MEASMLVTEIPWVVVVAASSAKAERGETTKSANPKRMRVLYLGFITLLQAALARKWQPSIVYGFSLCLDERQASTSEKKKSHAAWWLTVAGDQLAERVAGNVP